MLFYFENEKIRCFKRIVQVKIKKQEKIGGNLCLRLLYV